MGHRSLIVCDQCGAEAENTHMRPAHPLGWGELDLKVCRPREARMFGETENTLAPEGGARTLCPDCVETVRAVIGRERRAR